MESSIPSLSEGPVGSRFVTQDEIDSARARKDEQWKAAYARHEPPQLQQQDEVYDGRSLAEKLAANKIAKQEEWEEKNKLANQFRALEEDEIHFLDSIREKQEQEEKLRKQTEGEELKNFREAVAARNSAAANPPPSLTPSASKPAAPKPPNPSSKKPEGKRVLKGIIVKKKVAKPAAPAKKPEPSKQAASTAPKEANKEDRNGDDDAPNPKRRKIDSGS
ncbi:hypothetical protein CC1G_06802 [Coprinopsis cinerea okayama7|uniref:FAM192A/Fyv6 N-terminal domain-containing protein n=1 Tax=Coprinopsis cinerea (strain Okayama-7 / 130 / ATCC MYA-4618 / FGSC 9003) TaxID=240176 RepID=A8N1S4_COPC7|nr:hypothetical protein CC1G_06802 [Coprinopsis cinerea okayama7\|eukprot:XP_001828816.1 hypothetical protein CC1G_06802 [Coprinopsis cinerea okayama7\